MSTAPEDFEQFSQLAELKRHEAAPPALFQYFSSRVWMASSVRSKTDAGRLWEKVPLFGAYFSA